MKNLLFVFDIDGTLIDSARSYAHVLVNAFRRMGIEQVDTDFDNYLHHTDSYALRYNYENNFDVPFHESLFEELDRQLGNEIAKHAVAAEVAGARSFINTLRKTKTPFAFATGAFPAPTHYKMKKANIWYSDELLVTSINHITRETMVSEAIEKAKDHFKTSGEKAIISVGDGLWDLQTANNLGIDFIGIGQKNKDVLMDNGCKRWFENITEMRKALS